MKRVRSTAATALVTIAALGVGAVPAVAGSHYSQKKCNNVYNKAAKKYKYGPKTPAKKRMQKQKKLSKVLTNLTKQHGCHIGG